MRTAYAQSRPTVADKANMTARTTATLSTRRQRGLCCLEAAEQDAAQREDGHDHRDVEPARVGAPHRDSSLKSAATPVPQVRVMIRADLRPLQALSGGMSVVHPCPPKQCCRQEWVSEERQRLGQRGEREPHEDVHGHSSEQE